jgi:glycosyltransferase domain-containing protein
MNVTVGLFTYQRPKYLRRQLKFFKELGRSFRLIVLDGSEADEVARINKGICEEFNVEYAREISLQSRHLILNEKLDTDFVAYAADDDLIFPGFYGEGARFLEKNREYSVVAGLLPALFYAREYLWFGYYFRNHLSNRYDFHHGDFVERILRKDQSYFLGCPPTFYGVRRGEVHRMLAKYVGKLRQYSSIERLENICNCLQGGMKVMDIPMGFRDYCSGPIRQPQRDDPEQYICDEDIEILQNVIREELRAQVKSDDLLEYFAGYAWPLPLRYIQSGEAKRESKAKRVIECLFNKYFAHLTNPFNSRVTQVLREVQRELRD